MAPRRAVKSKQLQIRITRPDRPVNESDSPLAKLSWNIRRLRTAKGWTQNELASQAGISDKAVLTIENRPEFSCLSTLIALSNALQILPAQLLQLENRPVANFLVPVDLEVAQQAIGDAIKRERMEKGWSLRDFAGIAQVSHISLARYEAGKRDLSLRNLFHLAERLDHRADEFLAGLR